MDITALKKDIRLQEFWSFCAKQDYIQACSWLLLSDYPDQRSLWRWLETKVDPSKTHLYLFVLWHADILPETQYDLEFTYSQVREQLPHVSIYREEVVPDERIAEMVPSKTIEQLWWELPFRLHRATEADIAILQAYCDQLKQDYLCVWVLDILLKHRENEEWLLFFCGIYLWIHTFGSYDPSLQNALGKYVSTTDDIEGFSLASKGFFCNLIPKPILVAISDMEQIPLYDLERQAYEMEIHAPLVQKALSQYPDPVSKLYAMIPLLDQAGSDSYAKLLEHLSQLTAQYPEQHWFGATLLYVRHNSDVGYAGSIEVVAAVEERLRRSFANDPLVQHLVCSGKAQLQCFLQLPSSMKKYRFLHHSDPENSAYTTMYNFAVGVKKEEMLMQHHQTLAEEKENSVSPILQAIVIVFLVLGAVAIIRPNSTRYFLFWIRHYIFGL